MTGKESEAQTTVSKWNMVVHTYNPRLGGRGRRIIMNLKLAWSV